MINPILNVLAVLALSLCPLAAETAPGPFTVPPPYPVDGIARKDDCIKQLNTYYQAQETAYKAIALKLANAIAADRLMLDAEEEIITSQKGFIAAAQTELKTYETAHAQAFTQAQATITRDNARMQPLQRRIQADQAAMTGLDPKIPADAKKIARLQADINTLTTEANNLKAEIATAQATIDDIQDDRARLQKKLDDERKLLTEYEKTRQMLRAQLVLDVKTQSDSDSAWRITKKQWDDQLKTCKDKE